MTRHYCMNNNISVPWDSGTLTCDISDDASRFRLQGNMYFGKASNFWQKSVWVPGASVSIAGIKTFKVKEPSSGKAKTVLGAGLKTNPFDDMNAGYFNYDELMVGSDGYVYVMCSTAPYDNDRPIVAQYFGIELNVDELTDHGTWYVYGNGS